MLRAMAYFGVVGHSKIFILKISVMLQKILVIRSIYMFELGIESAIN